MEDELVNSVIFRQGLKTVTDENYDSIYQLQKAIDSFLESVRHYGALASQEQCRMNTAITNEMIMKSVIDTRTR